MGAWQSTTQYHAHDAVSDSGSSYVADRDPPIGTKPQDTSYWSLLSQAAEKAGVDVANLIISSAAALAAVGSAIAAFLQYGTLKTDVGTAMTTATGAATAAAGALTAAQTADGLARGAQNTANQANTAAGNAQTTATNAQNAAQGAQNTANQANTSIRDTRRSMNDVWSNVIDNRKGVSRLRQEVLNWLRLG
jgi:hypothetical protein